MPTDADGNNQANVYYLVFLPYSDSKWIVGGITSKDLAYKGLGDSLKAATTYADMMGFQYKGVYASKAEAQKVADAQNKKSGGGDKHTYYAVVHVGSDWEVIEISSWDLADAGFDASIDGAWSYVENTGYDCIGVYTSKSEARNDLNKQIAKESSSQSTTYYVVVFSTTYWTVSTVTSNDLDISGLTDSSDSAVTYMEAYGNKCKGAYTSEDKAEDVAESLNKQIASAKDPKKPFGDKKPSIAKVEDKGYYKLVTMDDGTYGVYVPSTGESKTGLKSKAGAAKSAKAMAKKEAAKKLGVLGVDPGSDAVDTLLGEYEGRAREMYGQAAKEMAGKLKKHMEGFEERRKAMQAKVASGDLTEEQYRQWLKGQTMHEQWYRDMIEGLSDDAVSADRKAMAMLNGYVPRAYAENMNYATWQIENDTGLNTGFTLYNESAVARLMSEPETQLLPDVPEPKAEEVKDKIWHRQKISSAIAQSILQGESVAAAAKRLESVVGMDANAAVRAARTALTAAENLGRLDAGKRAKAMGIGLQKQWVATVDARTRDSHRQIDRETVELEADFSNGCRCPGDPTGPASEVYNCRCAMRYVVEGMEYSDLPKTTKEGLSYEEWKDEHKAKAQAKIDKYQQEYSDAQAKISTLQGMIPEDKDFGKLLHGGSKLSDWTPEKVASSKEFYTKKLQAATDSGNTYDIGWYQDKLAKLDEYDAAAQSYHSAVSTFGPEIEQLKQQAQAAKEHLAKLQGSKGKGSAYSEERKAATEWFQTREEADNALRGLAGRAWTEATQAERSAIHTYTGGAYSGYNLPLGGYRGSYSNFVGIDKVDINEEGYGKEIRDMTRMIEHSVTEEDMWLRRGVGTRYMDTFFGVPEGTDITGLSDDELQRFVGTSSRLTGFQSCGSTADTGFDKPVNLRIFVPSGTEAMYVEPISQCGRGQGLSWDGKSKQDRFGRELETIIQRGASYTCSKIERENGVLNIELEVHPEDGYWKFQQEG